MSTAQRIWVGIEAHVRPNGHIHDLEDGSTHLVGSRVENSSLGRASLIEETCGGTAMPLVLEWLLEAAGSPAVVLAWRVPGYRAALSAYYVKKRLREGWDVHLDDGIAVATRSLSTTSRSGLIPTALRTFPEGGFFYLWGACSAAELRGELAPSMHHLAHHGDLALPSAGYDWLAASGRSLGYARREEGGRDAMVFIGPAHVISGLASLRFGLAAERIAGWHEGPDAEGVWRHAPVPARRS